MKKGIIITLIVVLVLAIGGGTFYATYRVVKAIKEKLTNEVNGISQDISRDVDGVVLNYYDDDDDDAVTSEKKAVEPTKVSTSDDDESSSMSEDEAKSIGESLYRKTASYYWGNVETTGNMTSDGMYMEISNISEVKNTFSTQGFNQFIANNEYISQIDGSYYRIAADRGGNLAYLGNELQVESITDSKIIFKSIEKYAADENEWGLSESEVTNIARTTNRFVIVKENGSWKVEDYTMPN